MKQWLLIFIVGLALGTAIGWLSADRGESQSDPHHADAATGTRGTSNMDRPDSSAAGGRRRVRGSKAGARDASRGSPASRSGFVNYLQGLSDIDDLEEINFLELVRQSYQITMLSEDEAQAMLAAISKSADDASGDGEIRKIGAALILARWAELNGPAALHHVVENEEGSIWEGDADDMATIAMSTWVEANPEQAVKWFREQSSGGGDERFQELIEDSDVQTAFFAALARVDAGQARDMIMNMEGDVDDDAMQAVARKEGSEEGLQELLENVRTDNWRARQGILQEWSKRNAAAAAAWLEGQPVGEGHHQLVFRVGNEYLDDNVEAGAAWLMRQEVPENQRDTRYSMIIDQWAMKDLASAENWLENQPDAPLRDGAEHRLSRYLAHNNRWEDAFHWAAGISNQGTQDRAAKYVFQHAWRDKTKPLPEGILDAAEAAGFGEQTETWIGEMNQN